MVTGLPEATPLGAVHASADPTPAAAPQPAASDQSLGQGVSQAPTPTDGGQHVAGAPESQAPEQQPPSQPQISVEEFQRIQQQLQERETMLDQIKRLAEQQQAQQREQEFRTGIKQKLATELKRVINSDDENEIVDHLYGVVNGVVDDLTTQYQGQVEQYASQVQDAFWRATAPGFADHLVTKHNLPPEAKADLLQFPDAQQMELYAMRVKGFIQQSAQFHQQQAVAQQVDARRASGAFIPSGGGAGAGEQPLQPGTARELAPALKRIFGV